MMKTYNFIYAFMALSILGCSKSDENSDEEGNGGGNGQTEQPINADYTLLVKANGKLTGKLLNGDAETLRIDEADSGFIEISEPQLTSEDDKVLTMYQKNSDCSGTVTVHDFKDGSATSFELFADLGACTLTAKAIFNSGSTLYVAYEKQVSQEIIEFVVRAVDISGTSPIFEDIALEFNPEGLSFSNNKLFILGLDEEVTKEHTLTVLNADTNMIVFEKKQGFDIRSIFKNPKGDIILGYDELHATINSTTFKPDYTNYAPESAPNFTTSELRHFDSSGKMYYAMSAGSLSTFAQIPAVYDFDKNSAVLYDYKNFLTDAQLNFEFEIENTTMVHYDETNNLLLVGYKKTGDDKKGGLLTITPLPQPKLAGNLDLDGIPYAIYFD